MRWYTFFCLLVVELCVCFALSVKAKQSKDSGQLGIDGVSKSSEFGADESVDPDEAKEALHNHANAFADHDNEERAGRFEKFKEFFKSDKKLLKHLKKLSPNVVRPNNREQLSNLPEPRDLFVSLQFTKEDFKNGRVITWLKYFDAHGRKHELNDLTERRYEVLNLLMSIDGVDGNDLSLLAKKAEKIPDLKTFTDNLENDFKLESSLLDLLKKKENTPEDISRTLKVETFSPNDENFLQWLRYCQLYKTKYDMHKGLLIKDGKDFDNRILDLLMTDKLVDELVPLLTSVRETNGLKAFSDRLLVAVRTAVAARGETNANWLKSGKNPGDLYAELIDRRIGTHEQLPNLVQWLEFVILYNKNQGENIKFNAVEFLIPDRNPAFDLFYRAAILDKLKNTNSIKGIVADASTQVMRALKKARATPDSLKLLKNQLPSERLCKTSYENVIASYTKKMFPTLLEAN